MSASVYIYIYVCIYAHKNSDLSFVAGAILKFVGTNVWLFAQPADIAAFQLRRRTVLIFTAPTPDLSHGEQLQQLSNDGAAVFAK